MFVLRGLSAANCGHLGDHNASHEETSIREAKSSFIRLLREVEKGRAVRLTRRGKPVAVLLSDRQYERLTTKGDPDRNFLRFLSG